MNLNKKDIFENILKDKNFFVKDNSCVCFAPINIALIKYWGKSNEDINLAMTPSISVSSNYLGTSTQIFSSQNDEFILNGNSVHDDVFNKAFEFINFFRNTLNLNTNNIKKLRIVTNNNVPTSSGLATSASGFATLTLALNDYFSLKLCEKELSILARLGSGSACRSVLTNQRFVVWNGDYAQPFVFSKETNKIANNMKILILILDDKKKKKSSREAMMLTKKAWIKNSNNFYGKWLSQTKHDFLSIQQASNWQDFGNIIENNSLAMHRAINEVGIDFFNTNTKKVLNFISNCRKKKLFIYSTIDAGANIALIYRQSDAFKTKQAISHIKNELNVKILDFDKQ